MKEIILLNEITPTKSNIDIVSSALCRKVIDGEMNAVDFAVKSKWLTEVLTKATKEIKEYSLTEVQKYGKECNVLGAKVEVAETGTKYDYACDEKWREIYERMKPIEDELKAQQEKIKLATKIGADSVDTDSGEIVARKVIKTSETIIKITLGK